MEKAIEVFDLHKVYRMDGKELEVLDGVDFSADPGEFLSIIGTSGCGKSTLFRIISGLENDYTGKVLMKGCDIREHQPRLAYMLQKDLLLPWRTVWQNVVLPLELAGTLKDADNDALMKMADEFGLLDFLKAFPDELSGGMRQRTALFRTWLMEGSMMLLDEPFGALDALTRNQMQDWLTGVWENHRKTVLFITHDIEEAAYLSDRVYVMSSRPGKLTAEVKIKLARPRRREMLYTSDFLDYKKQLMMLLTDSHQ